LDIYASVIKVYGIAYCADYYTSLEDTVYASAVETSEGKYEYCDLFRGSLF
jgi:hypothetical protein